MKCDYSINGGFPDSKNICPCPIGYVYNIKNLFKCWPCTTSSNCKTCDQNLDNCLSCESTINNGIPNTSNKCPCSVGYVYDILNLSKCNACLFSFNCKTCDPNNISNCLTCDPAINGGLPDSNNKCPCPSRYI